MRKKKYAIIGGDMRSYYLAELLKKEYHRVEIYGFEKYNGSINETIDLRQALTGADIIVCGIPFLNSSGYVNMPLSDNKLTVKNLFNGIPENVLFVAGKIEEKEREALSLRKADYLDLLDREEMAVLNAIPSAEGAIELMISGIPKTIHGSRILILGYGRIGKVLARILQSFGAEVWVEARKFSDLAWIETFGYKSVHLDNLERYATDMDIIVNTIPHVVLTADILNKVRQDCLIIDLASSPGGLNFEHAKKLGLKVIWALGIPGKSSPLTAAHIIKKTIENVT